MIIFCSVKQLCKFFVVIIVSSVLFCCKTVVTDKSGDHLISIYVGNTATFRDISIKYCCYGHEHCSSSPDEPFCATVGVYFFVVSNKKYSREITMTFDTSNKGSEHAFNEYVLSIASVSADQKKVILKIVPD